MTVLVCDHAPIDLPALKSRNPRGVRISGSDSYHTSLIRGLLEYGTYDRYIFLERNSMHTAASASLPLRPSDPDGRATVATLPELADLDLDGRLVLLSTGPILHGLYGLQRLLGRFDAPCTGIVHSLHGSSLLPFFLGSMLESSPSANALVCSSESGRAVVERQLAHIARAAGLDPRPPFACPVIPLGLDADYYTPRDKRLARDEYGMADDEVVVLSVGRLSSRTKGDLRPLLLAFAQVARTYRRPMRLIIAGDDTEEQTARPLLRFCASLNIERLVSLRTDIAHDDKLRLLAAADIFVAASDSVQETFGLSVVEAMAAGLPVLASSWSGFKETVVHGETGLLVPTVMPSYEFPMEALGAVNSALAEFLLAQTTIVDVDAMAHALRRLVECPELRTSMGRRGRERAERVYHISRVIPRLERLWSDLLEASRGASAPSESGRLFSYPRGRVFREYPTRLLAGDDRIAVTPFGVACLDDGSEVLTQMADSERLFRERDLRRVLERVAAIGPVSVDEVERDLSATARESGLTLRAAVARLLKFGCVRFAAPDR